MDYLLFKALSDKNRLFILDMLADGELCACRLLEALDISQPTLSHHMKILQECGLVNMRKVGQWAYYSISSEKLVEMSDYLLSIKGRLENTVVVPE